MQDGCGDCGGGDGVEDWCGGRYHHKTIQTHHHKLDLTNFNKLDLIDFYVKYFLLQNIKPSLLAY